jgi:hypothetical protein
MLSSDVVANSFSFFLSFIRSLNKDQTRSSNESHILDSKEKIENIETQRDAKAAEVEIK